MKYHSCYGNKLHWKDKWNKYENENGNDKNGMEKNHLVLYLIPLRFI